MQSQRGSALTEFVIVAAVMAPLMFGIPMIGKMIDLKQTTVQASRYSAWETTVDAAPPSPELDQRFFQASTPIGDTPEGANTLWGDEQIAEDGTNPASGPLGGYHADTAVVVNGGATAAAPSAYAAGTHNGVEHAPGASEGVAFDVGQFVDALDVIADKSGGNWGMDTDGLIRGDASVTMQGNGWLDSVSITQGTVIMNDNWSVAGAREARDRVRSLVPAGALDEVGDFLGVMGKIPGIRELKYFGRDSGRGVFGYVDMEPLPLSETEHLRPLKSYEGD